MSDTIKDGIIEALNAANRAPEEGEKAFNTADGILSNLKALIQDDKIWQRIHDFEKKTTEAYAKEIEAAKEKLKDKDPMFAFNYYGAENLRLRAWKTSELIKFWDKLTKEYKDL